MDAAQFPAFGPASVGTFEAMLSAVSAALYLLIACAALSRAPRDSRTRLFLLIAITNLAPYLIPVLFWSRGQVAFTTPVILSLGLSVTIGSLALFHFLQMFPWRRPWIRRFWRWLIAGYLICPLVVAAVIVAMPADLIDLTETDGLLLLVVGFPTMVLIGIVLPFAGLLSLYKSWLASKRYDDQGARASLFGILIGQLGGGVLSLLVIPLLHFVLPEGPWLTIASGCLLAFGLLMPIAFWLGVWRYRVLSIDLDSPPGPM